MPENGGRSEREETDPRSRVVIVGAGFAGLAAARELRGAPVRVTVVDKRNHHLFQPLLYQVATAGLAATDIAAPIRKLLAHQQNAFVLLGRVTGIDTTRKVVELLDGEVGYDHLILAAGATNSYFGHDRWEQYAPGLKSLEEALDIRRRILLAYEAAEREDDPRERARWLTFVVVGGGPTGIELAGALAEIARRTMARNFRRFDPGQARVVLLEGGPRLLPTFPEALSARAARDLETLGVEVRLGTLARGITASGVHLGDEFLASHTVLWAAGIRGVPLAATLGVPLDRGGRVPVEPDLRVAGLDGVQVVGDLAAVSSEGKDVPGVAPAAIQMGRHAARNIRRALRGHEPLPFRYRDKGSMATIGRRRAVAVLGRLRLTGLMAWLAWLFVHLMALVGFRNRLSVLFDWAYAYFTYQRSARLILDRAVSRGAPPESGDAAAPSAPAVAASRPAVEAEPEASKTRGVLPDGRGGSEGEEAR